MRIPIFLIFFSFFISNSFSIKGQTLIETQDWINSVLSSNEFYDIDVSQTYYLKIGYDNFIISNISRNNFNGKIITLQENCVIAFNDLYNLEFKENENNIWLTFISKNYFVLKFDDKYENVRSYSIILSKKLNQNNMKERLVNALKHGMFINGYKLPISKF
jgi:hypothetical protein